MAACRAVLLLFQFGCSVAGQAGVGEDKRQIYERYQNPTFSVRETQPRGPVLEEYNFLGRKVVVHYENHLCTTELFHGITSPADAKRMLDRTQTAAEWSLTRNDGKTVEWKSGPLRAVLEKGVLQVTLAKEKEKGPQ